MPKKYENLNGIESKKSLIEIYKRIRERRRSVKDLTIQIPHARNKRIKEVQQNREQTMYTWIGHSTFLIQMNGLNIITDPVWARRMGLHKRLTEPGMKIEELPKIDIVVISHGHYDHLAFTTLRKLKGNPTYYVPVGLKPIFERKGFQRVIEANWWENFRYGRIQLDFVPAQHWTRRHAFDMNKSHWGGWVIRSDEASFYFVGDTAYFKGFKEIGMRFAIETVFMPIGAYEPEWFMKFAHINPEDAVKAFLELKANIFIPMHYGTYRLADDTGLDALERLHKEWKKLGLPAKKLKVLKIGETIAE